MKFNKVYSWSKPRKNRQYNNKLDRSIYSSNKIDQNYWGSHQNFWKWVRTFSDTTNPIKIISENESVNKFEQEYGLNTPAWIEMKGLNRKQFVVGMVKKHFPNVEFKDYDQIMEMGSIVSELGDFLIEIQTYYSLMSDIPDYADVKGLSEKEWKQLRDYRSLKTDKLRAVQRLNQQDREDCRLRCEGRVSAVMKELDTYKHNPLILIFDLRRKDLPLDVNQQISAYSPEENKLEVKTKSGSSVLTRTGLSTYFIIQYRKKLLEVYKEGGSVRDYIEKTKLDSFKGVKSVGVPGSLFHILTSTGHNVSIKPDGTLHSIQVFTDQEIKERGLYVPAEDTQGGTENG